MKVYVVVSSEGDYIGWFEHTCHGVFPNKQIAESVATDLREKMKGRHGSVSVEEHELSFGNDESQLCEVCKGTGGVGTGNFACPGCGCAGYCGGKP